MSRGAGNSDTTASGARFTDVWLLFLRRPFGARGGAASAPPRDAGHVALLVAAILVGALCALPIVAVAVEALGGFLGDGSDTLGRLARTLLPGYARTTLLIMGAVGLGTFVIGTGTAWAVTACEFPLRRGLEIALVVPLAFPAYVLAYAYTDLLDHPGAVQTLLRDLTGWGPRDYWFPEVRSEGGAALMLSLVLYPYVYLLARAAFLLQGIGPFVVARSLGATPWRAFRDVALPMAGPAVTGGVLLALMETIADFGTVAHFGVQTLATGIYTTWFTLGDRTASAQIALGLLAIALLLVGLERLRARNGAHLAQPANRMPHPRIRLSGAKAVLAIVGCGLPVLLGAAIPLVMLGSLAFDAHQSWATGRYLLFLSNSVVLASVAAVLTMLAAIVLGYHRRLSGSLGSRLLFAMGRLGYAVPGGVIAVGLFVPFAGIDNALDAVMRERFGISTGLVLSGSIALLLAAYIVRFLAAALGAWRGAEATLSPDLDRAALGFGASPWTLFSRIHLPILMPAAFTGALLVFVDTMKELPATLIVRPFGWDTLAVQAYRLAADERLEGAAVPSLMIVAAGLLPVILLARRLAR